MMPTEDELAARRPDPCDQWALDDVYHATDEEIAALPAGVRRAFLAQRARAQAQKAIWDAKYARDAAELRREVNLRNRTSSVRSVTGPNGEHLHVAFCACGFHGLQVADPELARREYDAHACTVLDGDAIHRNYRGPIDKRPKSTMVPALASERAAAGAALPGEAGVAPTTQSTTLDEDTAKRMALVELK